MSKTILMTASFLAMLAAIPAFAADSDHTTRAEIKADARSAADKAEAKLDHAGDVVSEKASEVGAVIERNTKKAGAAIKDKYADMKAYFTDDDDVKVMANVDMNNRLSTDGVFGAKVLSPVGKDIGKVEDILVDAEGDAERLIISDGGVLGLGGKLSSFDYDVIEGVTDNANVVVKLTEKSVKEARGFSYDANSEANVTAMPANLFSVKEMLGSKVVDAQGKAIATVDNVIFDEDDADYVIVDFDKTFGMGGDQAALDFEALDLSRMGDKYTFKLNAQQTAQFETFKASAKAAN